MKTVTQHIRERLYNRLGVDTKDQIFSDHKKKYIIKTQWSPEFERLMRNRLIMGAIRYGGLASVSSINKPQYDRITSIINRLQEYQESGNQEHLVDAANLCLVEYVEGDHPRKHFKAQDDEEHTEVTK